MREEERVLHEGVMDGEKEQRKALLTCLSASGPSSALTRRRDNMVARNKLKPREGDRWRSAAATEAEAAAAAAFREEPRFPLQAA